MIRLFRVIRILLAALACLGGGWRVWAASGSNVGATTQTTAAELEALLNQLQSPWVSTVSLEGAAGYKDNLLLSHANPEQSGFVRGGVESFLCHVPRGLVDYAVFLKAQGTRFFNGATVDHQELAFAGLQSRYRIPDRFSVTLDGQGYFNDQIFDVSDTEVTRVVAELQVVGVKVGPTLRWNVRPWLWVEGAASGSRENFRDGAYNATITQAIGRVGWEPSDRVEFHVEASQRRRDFDRRHQITVSGQLEDALLVVHERDIEAALVLTWGRSRHWKTTTRAGRLHYQDNGSGFLNYTGNRVSQEVEWSAGAWSVEARGEAERKDYEVQTVGRGISVPFQLKDEYAATLHVERKLSGRWALFAEYNWERTRSNEMIASYKVNEGLLGARWSWEK